MSIDPSRISAILFDYGNTLIEFGPKQVHYLNAALHNALTGMYGPCDPKAMKELRDRQYTLPFRNGYQENDNRAMCTELIREMYGMEPASEHVDLLERVRCESYLDIMAISDDVIPLLTRLRERCRLGLVSNYPISEPVFEGMRRLGLDHLFDAIVISADIGFIKPHPAPFEKALELLGLPPEECLYVGDNWLADVQGAKRIGMQAVYLTQFVAHERFDPQPGDFEPDERIGHLQELLTMFVI